MSSRFTINTLRLHLGLLVLLNFSIICPTVSANPTFGAEFTFTNDGMKNARGRQERQLTQNAKQLFSAQIEKRCFEKKNCRATLQESGSLRIIYEDGWWFDVSRDNNVLEFQTKPSTTSLLRSLEDRIQSDIFDVAHSIGLFPSEFVGAGHIHIGLQSTFEGNPKLFRDFLVDYANHPELAFGALGNDLYNSPPISNLSSRAQNKFKKVIEQFDNGQITDIVTLSKRIQKEVYSLCNESYGSSLKMQAACLKRIGSTLYPAEIQTLEIRAIRAQSNAREFILETSLFEARINHLKSLDHTRAPRIQSKKQPKTIQHVVDDFYNYITETGLDWEPYKKLLPEYMQGVSPNIPAPPDSKFCKNGLISSLSNLLSRFKRR